jgi:hypothetical protein
MAGVCHRRTAALGLKNDDEKMPVKPVAPVTIGITAL